MPLRVKALIYRVNHRPDTSYGDARLVEDLAPFKVRIADDFARFELKSYFDDVEMARAQVEQYIQIWERSAARKTEPGDFQLDYQTAELEPVPAETDARDIASATVTRGSYPKFPDLSDPDVAGFVATYPRPPRDVTVPLTGVSARAEVGNLGAEISVPLSARSTARSSAGGNLGTVGDTADTPLPLRAAPSPDDDVLVATGTITPASVPNFRLTTDWAQQQAEFDRRLEATDQLLKEALAALEVADEARRRMGGNFPPVSIDGEEQPPGTAAEVAAGVRAAF